MKFPNCFTIFVLFLLCNLRTYSASIEGFITDSEMNDPLIGANIIIIGTYTGAVTNVKGYYIIKDLSPGKYKLRSSYIGFKTRIDSVTIVDSNQIIKLNIKLKVPYVDLNTMSTPKIEAYHKKLHEINKIKPVLLIDIDSLTYSKKFLTAHLSMKNNVDDSIYVFKNYPCFQVIFPIIKDSTGKLIRQNMGMYDCLGEKECPDLKDLILIKPGEKINYPVKIMFYDFGKMPKGKYSIEIKYEFNNIEKFNTFFCGRKFNPIALVTGLRGSYVSSNSIEFNNK